MLKFSKANAKLKALKSVPELQSFLTRGRKVYSYDSGLSGWTCPGAKDCLAKVYIIDGRKKLKDGPDIQFRCFSASQEVLFPSVYNQRKANFDFLSQFKDTESMAHAICSSLPKDAGIIRINVSGDIFSQMYFDALTLVAKLNPHILFYAYTKSLKFWVRRINNIPDNFVLTASVGGKYDELIDKHNLRYAKVVDHPLEAAELGFNIDHTDELAANPSLRNESFALLLHGVQPANTNASQALKILKKEKIEFSYK